LCRPRIEQQANIKKKMNKPPRCAKTLLKILFTRMNPHDSNPGDSKSNRSENDSTQQALNRARFLLK
jgi:hypothetical protein